jgi:hypothetical protein
MGSYVLLCFSILSCHTMACLLEVWQHIND